MTPVSSHLRTNVANPPLQGFKLDRMAVGMLRSAGRGYDASGGQRRFRDAFGDQSMISGRNLPIDAAVPGEPRLLNLIKEFVGFL
jgi:hypothetical protein